MYYIVYETTNNINGHIYIGVHITSVIDDGYVGSGKVLQRAIKKYGLEYFTRKIYSYTIIQKKCLKKKRKLLMKIS